MKEFEELLKSISQIKEYFPKLINNVEFCFYKSNINFRLKPYFTHNKKNIFILKEYFDSLSESEKKFILILNLLINHDLNDTIGKSGINSIDLIKYYSKLMSFDKDLMRHISIPKEYNLNIDDVLLINPFNNGHTKMEEEHELHLFLEHLPNLKYIEEDINNGSSLECTELGFENELNSLNAYKKKYYGDVLYLYWQQVSSIKLNSKISDFLKRLILNIPNQEKTIAQRSIRRGIKRWNDIKTTNIFNADEIVIHYNGVEKASNEIAKMIEESILDFKSKSNISDSLKISVLEDTSMIINTILIEAKRNNEDRLSKSLPNNISFTMIDSIDKILDYPNENILLFDNLSILYRLDKSI